MVQLGVTRDAVIVWRDEAIQVLGLADGAQRTTHPYPAGVDPRQGEFAIDRGGRSAVYGQRADARLQVWALGETTTRGVEADGGIVSLELSANGLRLLTVSEHKLAQAFDATDGAERGQRRLVGHGPLVTGAFTAGGEAVLAVGYDKASLFGFQQADVKPLMRVACGGDPFGWGDITDDASQALLVRASGEVCLWTADGLQTLGVHTHEAQRCWITPHGARAVSVAWSQPIDAPYQQEVKVWDTAAGGEMQTWRFEADALAAVALSLDGGTLLVGHAGPRIEAYDVVSGERRWSVGASSPDDFHPAGATGRSVLIELRDEPSAGDERDRAGGDVVRGLSEWPACPRCERPQTLLLTLAADSRKLPLLRHDGLAVFACLDGCGTRQALLLKGDKQATLPTNDDAQALTPRALLFHPTDDAEPDAQLGAPARLGGAPDWPPRTIHRVSCDACGETMTYRAQLQPRKALWDEAIGHLLGDLGWVFVCPRECTAAVQFWSY